EQRNALAVQRLEAGRRVGDALTDDARHDPREQPDPDAARARRAVARPLGGEARADRDVGIAAQDGRDDESKLPRIMLAVSIHPDREVVPCSYAKRKPVWTA